MSRLLKKLFIILGTIERNAETLDMYVQNCAFRIIVRTFSLLNALSVKLIAIKEHIRVVFWRLIKNNLLIFTKFIVIFKKEKINLNAINVTLKWVTIVSMNAVRKILFVSKVVIIKLTLPARVNALEIQNFFISNF